MFERARFLTEKLAFAAVLAAIACLLIAVPSAQAATPANDNFASAEVITGLSGQTLGSNIEATVEPGEPDSSASVWYRWVAPEDGFVSIDTRGSSFDTTLRVFTGDTIETLDQLAYNDDTYHTSSYVEVPVVAGTAYVIVVKGWDGRQGNIVLNWAWTLVAPASSISGQVTDADRAPISDADVRLYESNGSGGWDPVAVTNTGSDASHTGKYAFKNLVDGQYKVSFERDWDTAYGQVEGVEYYNEKRTLAEADLITVVAGSTFTADAVLELPAVSISGQVTDAETAPIADAGVSLYESDGSGGWYYDGYVYTGDDLSQPGKYEFRNLPDGQYKISFEREWDTAYGPVWSLEYYDDMRTLGAAEPITVVAGASFIADAVLDVPAVSISGQVTDSDSAPINDATVNLYESDGSGGWDHTDQAYTGNDSSGSGMYAFGDLPDGQYKISFGRDWDTAYGQIWGLEYYNDKGSLAEADLINVVSGSIFTANAMLEVPTVSISGQVTDSAGAPINDATVNLHESDGSGGWHVTDQAYTDNDSSRSGMYAFGDLPAGRYKISFGREWVTAYGRVWGLEYYNDKGTLAEADLITVVAGSSFTANALLEAPAISIGGQITDVDAAPIYDVNVSVYARGPGGWSEIRYAYTGNDPARSGKYEFRGLPDGQYKISFDRDWDPAYGPNWAECYNNKRTLDEADPVTVVAGSMVTANAILGVTRTLNYTASNGGSVEGAASQEVAYNASGTAVTAKPAAGYHFVKWSDGVTTVTRTDTAVIADKAVTAIFAADAPVVIVPPVVRTVTRLAGAARWDVAANLARKGWDPAGTKAWPKVAHIIIANGENGKEADPLTAAGLAGAYDAPVLLTQTASLPAATKAIITEIARKNPRVRIHLIGGTASVPDARWNEIKRIKGVSTTKDRIAGANRYDVSANIANRIVSLRGAAAVSGLILIAADNPAAFYDALAASPIAYAKTMPMLSVKKGSVPPSVAKVMNSAALKNKKRYAASSASYIGAGSLSKATRLTNSKNRYTAASNIANFAIAQNWASAACVGLTAKLPDALTGSAYLGKRGGVMLFTDSSKAIQPASKSFITAHKTQIVDACVMGGTGSVPEAQRTSLKNLLK